MIVKSELESGESGELAIYDLIDREDIKTVQVRDEQDKVYHFLAGLEPNLESVAIQIHLAPEICSVPAIVATTQQEERANHETSSHNFWHQITCIGISSQNFWRQPSHGCN